MAKSLELGVLDLLAELLAHTFRVLASVPAAGAVSSRPLKPFFNGFDDLRVLIQSDFQNIHLFLPELYHIFLLFTT